MIDAHAPRRRRDLSRVLDIRPTGDGDFAVFHDDVLDCKTNASGPVAARTMEELRALDVDTATTRTPASTRFEGRASG